MEPVNERLDRSVISKFKGKTQKSFTTSLFYLMKELHIQYSELMEMPIPSIIVLIQELQEHSDREAKEMKKSNRK